LGRTPPQKGFPPESSGLSGLGLSVFRRKNRQEKTISEEKTKKKKETLRLCPSAGLKKT